MTRAISRLWNYITGDLSGALFVIGALGLLFNWHFVEEHVDPLPPIPDPVVVPASEVFDPKGKTIGWLRIIYQRTLRDDEDSPLKVRYMADPTNWSHDPRAEQVILSVSVSAANLVLQPEPLHYTFSSRTLLLTRADERTWLVSTKKPGDYHILIRFDAPPGFRSVAVNGVQLADNSVETSLPVTVYTPYRMPQMVIDGAKLAGTILSFLLTLPLATILLTKYLEQRKKRARRQKK
jgi:hypothetical protein